MFLYSAWPISSVVCHSLVICVESSYCSSFQLHIGSSRQQRHRVIGCECCDSWLLDHDTIEIVPCSA